MIAHFNVVLTIIVQYLSHKINLIKSYLVSRNRKLQLKDVLPEE